MPCYKPIDCVRLYGALKPGEKRISFKANQGQGEGLTIPCGQCIGCRLERSRQWACRLLAEAQCHEKTSFLTLTYKEMPPNSSLNNSDFTLFMKRLRRHLEPHKIRFFQCGEYGERTHRPHHHCILFGHDFGADRQLFETSQSGLPQYVSPVLDDLWGHGLCTIGDVTFESAAYVARYTLKKVSGPPKDAHYAGRKPEYATMSRRPGIGALWFSEYKRDLYPGDLFVSSPSRPATLPPRYFDQLLERCDPALYQRVKAERGKAEREAKQKAGLNFFQPAPWEPEDSSPRLMVKDELKQRTITDKLKRGIS